VERGSSNWSNIRDAKNHVYYYCIFANRYFNTNRQSWGSSGLASGIPGQDFMVTLGGWTTPGGTADEQAGTFMHELGHVLGLGHGGGPRDSTNYKPNYHSIMNYTWQVPDLSSAAVRSSWTLDYSRVQLPALDENALDETLGIGGDANITVPVGPVPRELVREGGAVDWNRDRDGGVDRNVAQDINWLNGADQRSPGEVLTGHNDWPAFQLSALQQRQGVSAVTVDEMVLDELTYEEHLAVAGVMPVGGLVNIVARDLMYDRRTGQSVCWLMITNVSDTPIDAPLTIVVHSVAGQGVHVLDADAETIDGYFALSDIVSDGRLDPGEDVTQGVVFSNPERARFRAEVSVFGVVASTPGEVARTFTIGDLAKGDFDGDGDVDLSDFATFTDCMGGSGQAAAGECATAFDADLDTDVDLADFAAFQAEFGG
jgi:hypothetical protein